MTGEEQRRFVTRGMAIKFAATFFPLPTRPKRDKIYALNFLSLRYHTALCPDNVQTNVVF